MTKGYALNCIDQANDLLGGSGGLIEVCWWKHYH